MPPPIAPKRVVNCPNCGRKITLVPGDTAISCHDLAACNARRLANQLTHPTTITTSPPLTAVMEAPPTAQDHIADIEEGGEPEPGSARDISRQQRSLAIRAVSLSNLTMDKIQEALEVGVEVTLKDGTVTTQAVQPMALASIMRELRPIVHEPVRADEAKTSIDRPLLQINMGNADEIRDAVTALRLRRERQLAATQPATVLPASAVTRQLTEPTTTSENDE